MHYSNTYTAIYERTFIGFESKLSYILEHETEMPCDDSLIDFFINHSIMSDLDIRQLKAYIMRQGNDSFMNLLNQLSEKISH